MTLVDVKLTEREAAAVCLGTVSYVTILACSEFVDPVTHRQVPYDFILTIGDVVEKINVAMGNPDSPQIKGAIATLRGIMDEEEATDDEDESDTA